MKKIEGYTSYVESRFSPLPGVNLPNSMNAITYQSVSMQW